MEALGADGDINGYQLFIYCMNDPVNNRDEAGSWSLPNWAKVAIGAALIVGAAVVATVATDGVASFAAGAAIGAAKGAVSGAIQSRIETGSWDNALEAAVDGAADGFLGGAISGFIKSGTKRAMHTWQHDMIVNYAKRHGVKPPMNHNWY